MAAPAQRAEPERRQVRKVQLKAKKSSKKTQDFKNISLSLDFISGKMSNNGDKDQCAQNKSSFGKRSKAPGRVRAMQRDKSRTLTQTHRFDRGRKHHKRVQTYFSVERFSKWLRRREKERSRSGFAVKISVVIHSGGEADVERASVGVRERDGEGVRQRERDGQRERGRRCSCAPLFSRDEKC